MKSDWNRILHCSGYKQPIQQKGFSVFSLVCLGQERAGWSKDIDTILTLHVIVYGLLPHYYSVFTVKSITDYIVLSKHSTANSGVSVVARRDPVLKDTICWSADEFCLCRKRLAASQLLFQVRQRFFRLSLCQQRHWCFHTRPSCGCLPGDGRQNRYRWMKQKALNRHETVLFQVPRTCVLVAWQGIYFEWRCLRI